MDKRTKEYKRLKAQGLGDVIENVTKKTGVKKVVDLFLDGKDCGCEERKQKLNTLYPRGLKARCLTEQEYKDWGKFKENLKLVVSKEEVDFVAKIYSDVFNRQYWRPDCITCSARPLIKMIERMDKVYELYKK